MQTVFNSQQKPQDYYADDNFCGRFPDAPNKCPFKDCLIAMPMKKHGYYRRYLIMAKFAGLLKIRRYVCPKCGRTVSMLPSFCLPRYTYGVEFIVCLMYIAIITGSKKKAAETFSKTVQCITRKQIRQYLSRLCQNRTLIQYGFDQISPGVVKDDDSPGDNEWTRRILVGKRPTLCPESNAEFHKAMGISFMSTRNRIA